MQDHSFIRASAALLTLLLVAPAAAQTQPAAEPLELTLFRARSAVVEGASVTAVDAVAELDVRELFGDGSACDYRVEVRITGGTGDRVVEDGWDRSVACDGLARTSGARLVETFSFAVRPGTYEVRMTVRSTDGDTLSATREFGSLDAAAEASDLFLAREVAWDSAGSGQWALRKGGVGIAAEAVLDVPTARPFLAYYIEFYGSDEARTGGTVTGTIVRPGGARVIDFPLQTIGALTVDRPIAGTVSLAGLPRGTYEFEVRVAFEDGDTTVRSQTFRVVDERAAPPTERRQPSQLENYFASLSDSAMARFDAVILWIPGDDPRRSFESLSADAKRQFLGAFFSQPAIPLPDGTTLSGVEALRVLTNRVNDAARLFGVRGQEGWRTDRGRMFVRYGPPADRLTRPFPGNETNPYEIWYYAIGNGRVYLFTDETGFGHYNMVFSTDPLEPSIPDWRRRAGVEAVEELTTHYGTRVVQ